MNIKWSGKTGCMSQQPESNWRQVDYESTPLPTEVCWPVRGYYLQLSGIFSRNFHNHLEKLSVKRLYFSVFKVELKYFSECFPIFREAFRSPLTHSGQVTETAS